MPSPGDSRSLCALSVVQLVDAYRAGALSPVDVVQAHLARIAEQDALLGSYICTLPHDALRSARQSERRHRGHEPLSPMDGIPIAVKDNIDVRGVPTSGSSDLMPQSAAKADAAVVARLRRAGAIL